MNNAQPSAAASRWPIWVAALGVLVFGLLYVAGGGYLATLGGSLYFLLAGLGMLVSSVLLFKRRLAGAWLFAAVMVVSIVWALVDAGLVAHHLQGGVLHRRHAQLARLLQKDADRDLVQAADHLPGMLVDVDDGRCRRVHDSVRKI